MIFVIIGSAQIIDWPLIYYVQRLCIFCIDIALMLIRFTSVIQAKSNSYRLASGIAVMAIVALVATSITSTAPAASYIEPDHTTELFQLEHIPLPQHRTRQLGKSLAIIAQRAHDASPANQLATARLLLLAMQLDPQNKHPYEISTALSAGKIPAATPQHIILQCLKEAQDIQRLLSQPQAGAQANELARQIKDACQTIQPSASTYKDQADWKGVLPALSAYKTPKKQVVPSPPKPPSPPPAQAKKTIPPSPKKPVPTKKSNPRFHLSEQALLLPVIIESDDDELEAVFDEGSVTTEEDPPTALARIKLTLTPCDTETSKTHFIKLLHSDSPAPELDATLKKIINRKYSNIPDTQGLVKLTDGSHRRKYQISLAGPLAMMLEASLANSALKGDLCILADINSKGELIETKNFWGLLSTLRKVSSGGTLIVSDQSLDLIEQLLVFKESEFFTRWEVLSASNIDQALSAAAEKSHAELQQASELFDTIQELAINKSVAQLAADHDVRDTLDQILTLAPSHLSASTLLLQGSGNRPTHLNTKTFRLEHQPLIEELNHALSDQATKPSNEALEKSHEELRAKLDQLEPLVDRVDRELHQDVLGLVNNFKKLAKLRERSNKRNNSESTRAKAEKLFANMQKHGADLIERVIAIDQTSDGTEADAADKKN